MTVRFLLFGVLVVALLSCLQSALGQEANTVYHSERGGFSVSFPMAWEKQEQDMGSGVWGVIALSPEESSSDFFFENISIIIVPADTTDLSEANARGIEVLNQYIPQFNLLDEAVGKIGTHSASWITYTQSYEGYTLKVIMYTIINGSEMYLVTCAALPETFERFLPVFESIGASIDFDEPATPRARPITQDISDTSPANTGSIIGGVIGAIVGFYFLFRHLNRKEDKQ